jgi:hypothetical protein
MKTVLKPILALVFAAICALASARLERKGPDHGVYCALGKVDGYDIYCPELKLSGGWPAPFLFDRPGISVEGKLSFIEDDFRFWPFLASVSFYLVLLLMLRRGLAQLPALFPTRKRGA